MKTVIITAAGSGSRFGSKKQFACLNNKLVLDYSVEFFNNLGFNVIITVPEEDIDFIVKRYGFAKIIRGGAERSISVYNGLQLVDDDYVIIHDAARPILLKEKLIKLIEAAKVFEAATLAIKCTDTLKYVQNSKSKFTIRRDNIYCTQTPQIFNTYLLRQSFEIALKENINFTDEASLWEHYISSVYIIEGFKYNIKITTKEDLNIIGCLLNDNIL